jgi:hypothetical protein
VGVPTIEGRDIEFVRRMQKATLEDTTKHRASIAGVPKQKPQHNENGNGVPENKKQGTGDNRGNKQQEFECNERKEGTLQRCS